MGNEIMTIDGLVSDARKIIDMARANAARSVDFNRVMMYWNPGRRIFEEEQQGKERAESGAQIIRGLAARLEVEYGSGFGVRQLDQSRKFYRLYPIAHTLCAQLNWSQYKLLISIEEVDKREYYQLEAVNNNWTKRELERQIHSQLWERLSLSNDKAAVLAVARKERIPETPQEIIKDPMRLEFLGLEKTAKYYESDLEQSIIDHLQDFILELGNGFCFVSRQRRILLDDDEFFVDLVVLQPAPEVLRADRAEDRRADTSGSWTASDVCQLLRPQGEVAGGQQDDPCSRIQAASSVRRAVVGRSPKGDGGVRGSERVGSGGIVFREGERRTAMADETMDLFGGTESGETGAASVKLDVVRMEYAGRKACPGKNCSTDSTTSRRSRSRRAVMFQEPRRQMNARSLAQGLRRSW